LVVDDREETSYSQLAAFGRNKFHNIISRSAIKIVIILSLPYKTHKCFDEAAPSSPSRPSTEANFGNTRLYNGRQTVSCCLMGALKRHFITP
jgi:hypothetical protein